MSSSATRNPVPGSERLPPESGSSPTAADPGCTASRPHRGPLLLTFAALSYLICGGFAVAAWWMARRDLAEIEQGTRDAAGLPQTRAALMLAVANMVLHVVAGIVIVVVTAAILMREYYR